MTQLEQLKEIADAIARATQVGENTAERVGNALQLAAELIEGGKGGKIAFFLEETIGRVENKTPISDDGNIVYVSNERKFAFRPNGTFGLFSTLYSNWQGADEYMNEDRTEIIKDKIYVADSGDIYSWSTKAQKLVSATAEIKATVKDIQREIQEIKASIQQ